MIATDIDNIIEQVRESARTSNLSAHMLECALDQLEECKDRVLELEHQPPRVVTVEKPGPSKPIEPGCTFVRPGEVPVPPGMREVARHMPGVGTIASFEPDPTASVVRLEDFRGRRS